MGYLGEALVLIADLGVGLAVAAVAFFLLERYIPRSFL